MILRLAVAACAGVCAAAIPVAVPAGAAASGVRCSNAHAPVRSLMGRPAERAIRCLVNALRVGEGRRTMRLSPPLALAARRHSREMLLYGYIGHLSPGGRTPDARIRSTGYLGRAHSWSTGEALAFDSAPAVTPAALVAQLRRSPPHRAILLSRSLRDIGVGLAAGSRGVILTIDGGRRG